MDTFKDLSSAFCESLAKLKRKGSNVSSRGSNQREMLFHNICITDPTALTIAPPIRKFKPTYAIAEWLWYLSRDRQVKNIGKFADVWNQIQDAKANVSRTMANTCSINSKECFRILRNGNG